MALPRRSLPDWLQALADMNRRIELFPRHDPEAYQVRASIHENLGNHTEADRDRQMAE